MESVHILRLRRFAEHLMSDRVSKDYSNLDFLHFTRENQLIFFADKYYQMLPWFEEELDVVFPGDFTRNFKSQVTYIRNPRITPIYVLPEFFHLTTEEFFHCFAIARQNNQLGRYRMAHTSTPKHCGRIIIQFLEQKIRSMETASNIIERRVIVEKYGKRSPDVLFKSIAFEEKKEE